MDTYTTGTGQVLYNTHPETPDCQEFGCVIHNPTDPHQDWPTHFEGGFLLRMNRRCPCGNDHPDKDWLGFVERLYGEAERAGVESLHRKVCLCHCCGQQSFVDLLAAAYR